MAKLVIIRHGESIWNRQNRFTGWTDVDLTRKGVGEAVEAGKVLKRRGYAFDIAFTSVLKKAVHTLWHVLDEADLLQIPVRKSWRLNERHYGALQGLNKAQTAKKFGEKQVLLWRRSYAVRPPLLNKSDPRYPGSDSMYKNVSRKNLPVGESLRDTVKRVMPYWRSSILPEMRKRKKVLLVAHGNSIRAIVKHLDKISDEGIVGINIPTGIPLVYEFSRSLKPLRHYYLGSRKEIAKRTRAVVQQGKAK
ncbi:2,3-diphosphoglycerate-dependent phosphoglycerate mutase [Candidatus Woesearchaeota archaeon]|nr:2,3-diphosphoglycerate-dependent phosphoglycerate mutase [Candidatus Woesearchaeota archaeon]